MHPSMGSVGDCFDNAMAESFFATLECELIDRSTWRTHDEARRALFEFIEGWYNPRRRHSRIDYLSPMNYERQYELHEKSRSAQVESLTREHPSRLPDRPTAPRLTPPLGMGHSDSVRHTRSDA